jgi:RNA polymerase sigma-70 factor, ECF subfamily
MPKSDDEEIVSQVQNGDTEAFGILVERYEAKIMRYGKKFLLQREDIKDLTQEVFLRAFENIHGFDAKKRFSPWLYRIAHNHFINTLKKKTRRPINLFDFDTVLPYLRSNENLEHEINRQELKKMLNKCLGEIGLKYREALILFYFEQMSYQEIAEILHIPVSTVGIRLKRGRALLYKIYNHFNNLL